MTEQQFQKTLAWIRKHPLLEYWLPVVMRTITHATVVGYGCLLIVLFTNGQYETLYRCVIVPAVSFVVVSLYRKKAKELRPYEMYDITPLVEKEATGNSFPSRHVFSIMLIAVTFFQVNTGLGILFFVLGIILAILRVLSGVHFVKDVVAGSLIGLLTGGLGYFLLNLISQ